MLLLVGVGQNLRPFSRTLTSYCVKILSDKFMIWAMSFEFIASSESEEGVSLKKDADFEYYFDSRWPWNDI